MTAPDCPDPQRCPVPDPRDLDRPALRLLRVAPHTLFHRVYELRYGYDTFNPGGGDSRFAPLVLDGFAVPTLYGGDSAEAVLLETVFHDVHESASRVIYAAQLRERGLARLRTPRSLRLIDLRDEALAELGLRRDQLVATTRAHYPCTREWAAVLHGVRIGRSRPEGLIWHSRQAELHAGEPVPQEVFMLFGDRAPHGVGDYELDGVGVRTLVEGPGLLMVERLAEDLDALVVPL